TCVFPLVVFSCTLVILCCNHRNYRVAVGEAKKGKLPAIEPSFYIHPLTGVAEYSLFHNRAHGIFGLLNRFADQGTLAGSQTVCFDNNRISDAPDVVAGFVGFGEVFEFRHRNSKLPMITLASHLLDSNLLALLPGPMIGSP